MKQTSNYKLNLPEANDDIDITVLDENFKKIDTELKRYSKEIEPITTSNALEVISASGEAIFYHFTASRYSLLDEVQTTWGAAEFRERHGDYHTKVGSVNDLYIHIYTESGKIYWDEYYEDVNLPENTVYIGQANVISMVSDSKCSFSYTNHNYGQPRELSLRQAIVELISQVEILRKGNC